MRILILNLSDNSAAEVNDALAGQGYEIVSESALDVEQIQALGPELLVTEATPSDLSCCGIITQIKSRKDTSQLNAEVLRLSRGVVQQGDLLKRVEDQRRFLDGQGKTDSATRDSLLAQSETLKKRMASQGDGADSDLRKQLQDTQTRLSRIETEGKFAETIVRNYGSSVCLLHVVVEFLDHATGKPILVAVDQLGKPLVDDKGMVQLDVDGSGPHLQLDVFGTGFLVRKDGRLLTNHHVAEPWWGNDELKALTEHGASAYVLSYTAYFPG